jgi:acetyltransferase-like isoleucine patch superfamily enzyme
MKRLLAMLPPLRWWRTLRALKYHARVHPQALLLGRESQVELGHGCKVGARVRIDPGMVGCVKLGERVWIAADVEIQTDSEVQIREGTSVQRRCTINGSTSLGRDCILAPGVFISSGTHPFRAIPHLNIREQERRLSIDVQGMAMLDRPIWVQDDCWLGTNVVVCPGVTIGKGSVVGANAVVTHDVPPYCVVAGSPARVIGKRLNWHPPSSLDPAREEDRPYFLDARLRHDNRGICIEVLASAPLYAALSVPKGDYRLEIVWRAMQEVTVVVGQRKLNLPCGEGTLEINAADLEICHEVVRCAVALASDTPPGVRLDVFRMQVLEN